MKLLGMTLIVFSGVTAGIYTLNVYKSRLNLLLGIKRFFYNMKTQIAFSSVSFESFIRNSSEVFPTAVSGKLNECENVLVAWKEAVGELNLEKDDKTILFNFVDDFGRVDILGQDDILQAYIVRLDERISEAGSKLKNNGRLSLTVCISLGIAVSIMLI